MSNKNIGPIQSTAGAIPVKNEKGEISMQKVKVHRYVTGKRPDYARSSSDESDEDEELISQPIHQRHVKQEEDGDQEIVKEEVFVDFAQAAISDPRMRRLQKVEEERKRKIEEPKVLEGSDDEEENERWARRHGESDSESGEELTDDEEIERRRIFLRQRALEKLGEEEVLAKEDEKQEEEESEEESEYEEYTDSEEESAPRLKPVFVRKKERNTIKEKELLEQKEKRLEEHSRARAEERRKETLQLVEAAIRKERGQGGKEEEDIDDKDAMANVPKLTDVQTDDENEETEYEAWKLRELKRIKRDREEREAIQREKEELERLHNMTEDERRAALKANPKLIVNKSVKGKYKFLQKYYHRGVFYLDKEDEVFKKDFACPTLEDHFDKTILPKVMQVKNFGRSGRTKYTHLVDQDTTAFDSAWATETPQALKFASSQAAGSRPVFSKPSFKKRKTE